MKIAQYVETFSYVGMFNTMNFAYYICLWVLQDVSEDPVSDDMKSTLIKYKIVFMMLLIFPIFFSILFQKLDLLMNEMS